MSRTVEISLSPEKSKKILPRIKDLEGLIGLRVQKDISVYPKGDVIAFELTNNAVSPFLNLLESEGMLEDDEVYITTNKPVSVLSRSASSKIMSEGSESSWEEIVTNINHESTMTFNGLVIMFVAGFVAVYGISANSLHIVIGAMVIAPGFEPITRIMLGLVTTHRDWKSGLKDTLKGYTVLLLGAIAASLSIKFFDQNLIPGTSSYLPSGVLIDYWTQITLSSVMVSIVAAFAGAAILVTNKSVLTAGVMIALALIPAASIIGMGLIEGDMDIAGSASIRFLLEVVIVAVFSGLFFLLKRLTTMKRRMRA